MQPEDLKKIIREEYSKILSEQVDYDYAIDQFNTLYTNLQDLHQEIGTQLESENEQQFVTFSRYMGALETGLDNTVKFLKRKQRGQAATEPSIYPGRARESKIKEVK
tara:strand:+ start:87 stop:407 length:321 start_codon:yes stop_codon:yes gene_type:complete